MILAVTQLQKQFAFSVWGIPQYLYRKILRRARTLLRGLVKFAGFEGQEQKGALGQQDTSLISLPRRLAAISGFSSPEASSLKTPPGLGNLDSSCYQNSVIQALSSLSTFHTFLTANLRDKEEHSMRSALVEMMEALNDHNNAGKLFWLPPKLKNMNSWQQQDAQEYLSKVLDEVEKEALSSLSTKRHIDGLVLPARKDTKLAIPPRSKEDSTKRPINLSPSPESKLDHESFKLDDTARNPMEGLIAQRVGCLRCGYSDGLSMIPFTCLTLSIRDDWTCTLQACLDDYISLEAINGVECTNCTLFQHKAHLVELLASSQRLGEESTDERAFVETCKIGLRDVNAAIDEKDFSEAALKRCQLPKDHVTTTKTRQAVIGRAPLLLSIHINRSIFDEMTGAQRKNTTRLHFPSSLNLDPWCLGRQTSSKGAGLTTLDSEEVWALDPRISLASQCSTRKSPQSNYELKAVITHHGRHENGHYICFRRRVDYINLPVPDGSKHNPWWRFSDEAVTEVDEDFVLNQGGVFMLFYEKIQLRVNEAPSKDTQAFEDVKRGLGLADLDSPLVGESSKASSSTVISPRNMATCIAQLADEPNPHCQVQKPKSLTSLPNDVVGSAEREHNSRESGEMNDPSLGSREKGWGIESPSSAHVDQSRTLQSEDTLLSSKEWPAPITSEDASTTQRLLTPPHSVEGSDTMPVSDSLCAGELAPTFKSLNNSQVYPSPPPSPVERHA